MEAARELEEKEKEYPEPNMFGNTPAHGLFIRHAEDIEIHNCKVISSAKDARPCFVLDDVKRIGFSDINAERTVNTPVFVLNNAVDIRVGTCNALSDTEISEAEHEEL
jgi:hypothetical protein